MARPTPLQPSLDRWFTDRLHRCSQVPFALSASGVVKPTNDPAAAWLERASRGDTEHVGRAVPVVHLVQDLEALKLRLAAMEADAISADDTAAMAQEVGAIRLQLKRLRLDQQAMIEAVRRRDDRPASASSP